MNNELPSIYANKIDKNINNSQEVFYQRNNIIDNNESVEKKIKDIFQSKNFVYKTNVEIITNDGIINTIVVGVSNGYLLTMNNNKININKIKDIIKK